MTKVDSSIELLRRLPVAINCQLGDPLQATQWPDTLAKMERLAVSGHAGPVGVITKCAPSKVAVEGIGGTGLNVWLFMTVTGLRENKRQVFSDLASSYALACRRMAHVVINIQPVIPGRNDRLETLEPILRLAEGGQRAVVMRGYLDGHGADASYRENSNCYDRVAAWCDRYQVRLYSRTAQAVASAGQLPLERDADEVAAALQILSRLGYPLRAQDGVFSPDLEPSPSPYPWTSGDRNFIHLIAREKAELPSAIRSSVLSIRSDDTPLHCTSSWFTWARQVPCQIGCWYCSAAGSATSGWPRLGCNPVHLVSDVYPGASAAREGDR